MDAARLQQVDAELRDLDIELAFAADTILTRAEDALECVSRLAPCGADVADLTSALHAILAACAFQDLAGQRLGRIGGLINGDLRLFEDPLLSGPARPGHGLDQAAADAVFADLDAQIEGADRES